MSPRDNGQEEVMPPVQDSTTIFGFRYGGGFQTGSVFPGGVDLLTPSLQLHSGALRDCLNFEVNLTGGYGRIGGTERYSGLFAPSSASFAFVQVNAFTTVPTVGETIIQVGSGATGTVALVNNVPGATYIIVTQTSGSFDTTNVITSTAATTYTITAANPLQVTAANSPWVWPTGAVDTIGTAIDPTVIVTAKMNAQFQAAAADIYRALIQAVPGSGSVLGVVHMIFSGADNVYAFRANLLGTTVNIWKASAGGWVLVPFLNEIQFSNGDLHTVLDGETLIQGPATATIKRVMQRSGTTTWAGTAAGAFVITNPTFGFGPGAATTSGGATLTLLGPQVPITLVPGGKFEFAKGNFAGQLASRRVYGCDGANKAFEFDGMTVAPITTGLVPDMPSHVAIHKEMLFLAQGSSAFNSAPGLPFRWTAIDGALETATGDVINGMLTLPGAANTATLAIYMRSSLGLLYGTDPTTFNYTQYNIGIGGIAGSIQNMFDSVACAELGVYNLQTTLNFGNFNAGALTRNIQPFINQQRSKITTSTVIHTKGQYRLFFNDGYGLWLSFLNQQYLGATFVQFPNAVGCVDTDTDTSGNEVTYFGTTDDFGYVYQMDMGPSFDGGDLFAYFVSAWDYIKLPRWLKKFIRASLEVAGSSYAEISFNFGLGDNSPLVGQPSAVSYTQSFSVAAWDVSTWDAFFWDGSAISPTYVKLGGQAKNIQPVVGSTTNYIQPYSVNSIIYDYTKRRRTRRA